MVTAPVIGVSIDTPQNVVWQANTDSETKAAVSLKFKHILHLWMLSRWRLLKDYYLWYHGGFDL